MVEAGAEEVPEEKILEAFELAHGEITKICEAQEDLRRQAGKERWLDLDLTEELEGDNGPRFQERIGAEGLREAGAVVEELVTELAPADHDGLHRGRHPEADPGALEHGVDPRPAAPRRGAPARSGSSSRTT